ncbi:MAG: BrnT family toxin [Candidatus Marinimicrobia bacterium]|nr:BrnT family toxin [Candidatus Neomarinimicrobiota bacterium]
MNDIKFTWDKIKAKSNHRKHGVSFEEATTVFYDDFALEFYDQSHSQLEEDRFLMLGMSGKTRLLIVCHCFKEDDSTIRIISAREATKDEAKFYKR